MASKFTAEIRARIVTHVRGGCFRQNAAELVGVGERTLERWVHKGREEIEDVENGERKRIGAYGTFLVELLCAEAEVESQLVGTVHMLALHSIDPALRLKACTWYLERKKNLRYGRGALRVELAPGESADEASTVDALLDRLSQIERRTTATDKPDDGVTH